jgi:hypothetical protein
LTWEILRVTTKEVENCNNSGAVAGISPSTSANVASDVILLEVSDSVGGVSGWVMTSSWKILPLQLNMVKSKAVPLHAMMVLGGEEL